MQQKLRIKFTEFNTFQENNDIFFLFGSREVTSSLKGLYRKNERGNRLKPKQYRS